MWYSARSRAPGGARLQCLGVAVAPSPDGPFVDNATSPAGCDAWRGGSIDPDPFVVGPSMIRVELAGSAGSFLIYSAARWWSADYKVGVARCDGPLGPCTRVYSTPVLPSRGAKLGPGGAAAFQDAPGSWYLGFHASQAPSVGYPDGVRSLRTLSLTFPDGAPKIG